MARKRKEPEKPLTAQTHPRVPRIDDYESARPEEDTDFALTPIDKLFQKFMIT